MSSTGSILCTIHYIVDGQEHQYNDDLYLQIDIPVQAVIKRLIERIGLQHYLDEPQQGVPTLHTAPEAPPLDPAITLSAAGLVNGSPIWLVITPTYLPMTIHWSAGKSGGQLEPVMDVSVLLVYPDAMTRTAYPSAGSDEAWAFVAPSVTLMDEAAPQRNSSLRQVSNGLRSMLRTGAPWRMLPTDVPPRGPWWITSPSAG